MSQDETSSKEMLTCEAASPLSTLSLASLNNQHYPDDVHELFIRLGARPIKDSRNCFEIDGAQSFIAAVSDLEETDLYTYRLLSSHGLGYDIFEDKILIIRMPDSIFHSAVVSDLSSAIIKGINEVRAFYDPGSDTFNVLTRIVAIRRADIYHDNGLTCPDIQFKVGADISSPVVVEFSFSQLFGGIEGLAHILHSHIVGSGGETNIAIGLEWHEGQTRLSVWAPKIVAPNRLERNIILHRQLLTKESKETLDIYVKDFVTAESRAEEFPAVDQLAKISIGYADIADMVNKAGVFYNKIMIKSKLKDDRKLQDDCGSVYEKQEFFMPPRLLKSDINNDAPRMNILKNPRAQGLRSRNNTRPFSTLAKSTSGPYQPSLGLTTRASASGSTMVLNIGRGLPWIRRLFR